MKRIIILLLFLTSCQNKQDDQTGDTTTTETVLSDYYAEYGIPDQSLIQSCTGNKDLVRPISKCTRRSNNQIVNNSFCFNLEPVLMNIPSPQGERQVTISGGTRIDTCNEGSTDIISSTTICNPGFLLKNDLCQSYESVGSYMIQKDQIYKESGNLKILFTIGHDFSVKTKDNLKIKMILE